MSVLTKRRPTQAERSAGTQARVLKAAIRCLHTQGYSATTTLLVAEEAKVSRGAMLHQFPTKTDLMLFVVRSVFDTSVAQLRKRLTTVDCTMDDMVEVTWETLSGPSGIAALEVLLGSRSDPRLAAKLTPLQAQIERESVEIAEALDEKSDPRILATSVKLFHWAVRGLAIANILADDPNEIRNCLDLLSRMFKSYGGFEMRKFRSKPFGGTTSGLNHRSGKL